MGCLFASFRSYNPLASLLGPYILHALPPQNAAALASKEFFPHLIAEPFHSGLEVVFGFSLAMCLIAAVASWLRGGHYVCREDHEPGTHN